MAELIAQGTKPEHRWRRRMIDGQAYVVGRDTGAWSVAWDDHISRRHVAVSFSSGVLTVTKLPGARNPLFFQGQACDHCLVSAGQHFVLGSTTFALVDEPLTIAAAIPMMTEHTFSVEQVRRAAFQDATRRIDALCRLPEVIPSDISEDELCARLVRFLLLGLPRARWAAVVARRPGAPDTPVEVVHWDHRRDAPVPGTISEGLVRQAAEGGVTVAHSWESSGDHAVASVMAGDEWAFCTPLRGDASRGWCLYIAGTDPEWSGSSRAANLQDDVKFTELVADIVSRIRELRQSERRQAALRQFLSPIVLERLLEDDPHRLLVPRETDVSVLFCDLRGFSRVSEQSSRDLMGLLERVSRALGVMTHRILEQGGVVGDFHGDAAMGFWGWPLEQPDRIGRVCRAALDVSADFAAFAARTDHPLSNFRIGIGLATGRAVAGSIGTADQVKVTVFGPVVNLAARLQELTKQLRAPILTDSATADAIRREIPRALARVRRVARIRPRGLDSPVDVHQLLPPAAQFPQLADHHITAYEAALDQMLGGDWEQAFSLLHHVPAEDRVKDFLTVFIAQHHRTPPPDWDGVIDLSRSES